VAAAPLRGGTPPIACAALQDIASQSVRRFQRRPAKQRRQGNLKPDWKTGMEFISGESREYLIMLPDCMNDYITDNNPARIAVCKTFQ
jgi:hypothetical protein